MERIDRDFILFNEKRESEEKERKKKVHHFIQFISLVAHSFPLPWPYSHANYCSIWPTVKITRMTTTTS